jgi:hypothetical protein
MYVIDAQTVVLSSTPDDYWVTVDGGRTYRHDGKTYPKEWDSAIARRYPVRADGGQVVVVSGATLVPTPAQPDLPGDVLAAVRAGGRLVAASLSDTRDTAYTATSDDGGRTWQQRAVNAHSGAGRFENLGLDVSPDGADVWLLAYPQLAAGSVGRAVRKEVGLPALWRFDGGRWIAKGTVGRPKPEPMGAYSVALIGGGLAAVAGAHGFALVDDAWTMVTFFPRVEWVSTLDDGTVVASAPTNATVYLGARSGRDVRWTQISLEPKR